MASNPFFDAFWQSDLLGKSIFIALLLVSILSWSMIFYKAQLLRCIKRWAHDFSATFERQRNTPLNVEYQYTPHREFPHPYYEVYQSLSGRTREILNKNQLYGTSGPFLTAADLDVIDTHLSTSISGQRKVMDRYLFILATVYSLAPFLGLLGTVWGILTTFGELNGQSGGNQMMLSGLSLALTTTVLGLINAIPALVSYNYFKNAIREFQTDLDDFGHMVLSTVELAYRQVEQK